MQSWLDHDVFYEIIQSEKTNPSQKMPKTSFFLPFVVENIDRVWKQTSHCGEVVQSHLQVVLQQRQSNMQKSIYIELNRKERLPFEKKLLRTHHRHSITSGEWTCTFWKEGNSMSHLG